MRTGLLLVFVIFPSLLSSATAHISPVITRYISELGADTDGCGDTDVTACRTMHPVLAQLLAQQPVVPPDLIGRIDEVWNRAIDDVNFMLSRQEYPGPDENYLKTDMCSPDGIVNTTIIDLACQQIKEISEIYPTWDQLHQDCLSRLDWLVREMLPMCHDIHTKSCSLELACKSLGKSSYSRYERLLREIHFNMAIELNTTNVNIITDSDIAIIDQVFSPLFEQYYQVEFNMMGNRLIHITIRNNTFKNLYLHLNNSRGSTNVEENHFIGSGIIMIGDIEDVGQAITIQGNVFESGYRRSVLEISNMDNISLTGNSFKNLKLAYQSSENEEQNLVILCHNSKVKLFDSSFKNVTLHTMLHLNNCSFEIENVSVLENIGSHMDTYNIFINMTNSNGSLSNLIFENNEGSACIHAFEGELIVHNLSLIANQLDSSDSMIKVEASHILLTNVTAFNNTGPLMNIRDSLGKLLSSMWQQNGGNGDLFSISDSYTEIWDSGFEKNSKESENFALLKILDNSTVIILRSNFTANEAVLMFPVVTIDLSQPKKLSPYKKAVEILSCRFQGNVARKFNSLIRGTKAVMNFENCDVVDNNADEVAGFFYPTLYSFATISNCRFANNSASHRAGVIYILISSLKVQNTVFENNSCGENGGAIYASSGNIYLINSTFKENRSFGSDGGAICIAQESKLVSENCTFTSNTAAMEGGAVMVTDRSIYYDFYSLFLSNTASNYGGAVSVQDHSNLNLMNTNFTENKAESFYNMNDTICPVEIAFENDGGAIMVETYSEGTVNNCYFEGNEAADNGGAITAKIRSTITLSNSFFKHNKAKNNGGSILVQHSKVFIQFCIFESESVSSISFGYGGAIFAKNVANVTIQESSFHNCTAYHGGFVAIKSVSVLNIEHSNISYNYASKEGGAAYISQNSLMIGNSTTVTDGRSVSGAGIYVYDSSELNLNNFNFLGNTVNESGGAIYCEKGKVILDEGNLLDNNAKLHGGGVFGDSCQITLDNSKIINNSALIDGGGVYFEMSKIEIHNTQAINNSAGSMGKFGVITRNSKFESNNLHLVEFERNSIIFNNSAGEMRHTYLINQGSYCPVVAVVDSNVLVDSVYFIDENNTKSQADSKFNATFLCTNKSSIAQKTVPGKFPHSCVTECRCYFNRLWGKLVADCSHSDLTHVPDAIPEETDWLLLSGNNISSFSINNLPINDTMYHLSQLDLYNNSLVNISLEIVDGFIQTHTLMYLNISNNQLRSLPENIKNLTSLKTLKISGNKFKCSCKSFWMKEWLFNETQVVQDYENIKCQMRSGKWISVVNMDKADMGCVDSSGDTFSIWNILAISIVTILIAITAIVIGKKWELIKFWLFLKYGIQFKDKTDKIENIAEIDYDAFINYNVDDHGWVREEIVRFLEDYNYTLCIHTRDFVPTATIPHNIKLAIKHSRRMISVVTRKYLNSGWCKEEFQLAHLEAVEGRHRFIILIMVDDIPVKDLPDEMQKYVKTYTYLDATKLNTRQDWELFRKKIRYVMPQNPIKNYVVDMNDEYNPDVPPLFNRMFTYNEQYSRL